MIDLSVRKPVGVAVGVILVVLFGTLSLFRVPIQLTPDVVKPQITVETTWRGASPHEIEREIIDEQEEQLRGVESLERLTSESFDSMGRIILEFPPGTDLDSALIQVSNRLEQVPEYPTDADKPVILTTNKTDNAMAWFMLRLLPENENDVESYYRFADDEIKPRLERVPGVGAANIFGGREQELHVLTRPEALASRGITVPELIASLDRENVNVSAGDFTEGKRKYVVRTVGEYERPADVEKIVITTRDGRRVYLRDIADVRVGLAKRTGFVRQRGHPTLAINSVRKVGANVLETMVRLKDAVAELNGGLLRDKGLRLEQVYDETDYINEAIDNVRWNLLAGSILAIAVLFLFLRSIASTFIIAVAIPISVIGSFILMYLLGRTVNVVSLAGMSFAAGMVVDNSIVSLENIYRLRQEGMDRFRAALEGARQVWGAVLASTLTTIAVFVPVLFVEEKAAQIFRDIAIAISCAVGISLFVSITVIPPMAARLIRRVAPVAGPGGGSSGGDPSGGRLGLFGRFRERVVGGIAFLTGSWWRSLATVVVLTGGSISIALLFLPRAEYLPEGNRNLAIGILLPPPGYSIDEITALGNTVQGRLEPFLAKEASSPAEQTSARTASAESQSAVAIAPGSSTPARPSVTEERRPAGVPDFDVEILQFFFVARDASVFMGAVAKDPDDAGQLVDLLKWAVKDIPGLIAVVNQASLFERGVDSGRSVDIEITGPDLEQLVAIGGRVFGQVLQEFPPSTQQPGGHQARPIPSLDLQNPEVHVDPDRERARDLGLDARAIGVAVDAVIDGAKASEVMLDGREVDLVVIASDPQRNWKTQDLAEIPLATPDGRLVPLGSVSDIEVTRGPQQINHIERNRAITVQLVPALGYPLEQAVDVIREKIVEPLKAQGVVAPPYDIRLAGTVDDLYRAFQVFRWNFVLAVVITYLLMAALFDSFVYPFIVLFSVPLAAVGGVLCLDLVHSFAPDVRLDILTMLGFVILVGVVVNNAILIVYQTLDLMRAGATRQTAILDAVRTRVRPILMTTATSVFGMFPLVVSPGAGSELYRGLGSVVLGGLVISTVFTLVLIPALLSLALAIAAKINRLPTATVSIPGAGGGEASV